MLQIRTVLCPVDFTTLDTRELDLAVEVCRSFGARLILHHNVGNSPPAAAVSWMHDQHHRNGRPTEEHASNQLRELLAALPPDVRAEARLSNGMTATALIHLEEQLHADLVVLGTHGATTADHSSVAEQIIERSLCPVLVLHDGAEPVLRIEPASSTILEVLVPTDFSPAAERAAAYAFELARVLPLRLHLMHVISPRQSTRVETGVSMGTPQLHAGEPLAEARRRLAAMVPQDLENRVTVHVEIGDPVERIAAAAMRTDISCIIMGAHARSLLRRFFTKDTSLAVLHKAPCPVWFVPEAMAA